MASSRASSASSASSSTALRYLSRMTHVTQTHTSQRDIWRMAFGSLQQYGHLSDDGLGRSVRFVVCVDSWHAEIAAWGFLEQVIYTSAPRTKYPFKVASCLNSALISEREFVFHTMEDMLLTSSVQWTLVAAGLRALERQPHMAYFRFYCLDRGNMTCAKNISKSHSHNHGRCRNACPTAYPDITESRQLGIAPLVANRQKWADYHNISGHIHQLTSGSAMESHYNSRMPWLLSVGLQGFDKDNDYTPGFGTQKGSLLDIGYAYPYVHTGIIFSMWQTGTFAPMLCRNYTLPRRPHHHRATITRSTRVLSGHAAQQQQQQHPNGLVGPREEGSTWEEDDATPSSVVSSPWNVAGMMNCNSSQQPPDSPPCKCRKAHGPNAGLPCNMDGSLLRYVWNPPGRYQPFPKGCVSWEAQGRPAFPPASTRWRMIVKQLAASDFWGEHMIRDL